MDIIDVKSRLKILIVGSDSIINPDFNPLYGVEKDLDYIRSILFQLPESLYSDITPVVLTNPTAQEFRDTITQIVISSSVSRDILLLYYSGHGVMFKGSQFGFVCKDTKNFPRTNRIIPSTIVTSTEIIDAISVAEIIPFFLIDACHSGLIQSTSMLLSKDENLYSLRDRVHGEFASDFVIFAACAGDEFTEGNSQGGFFSNNIHKVATRGNKKKKKTPILTVNDIYQTLIVQNLSSLDDGVEPRLFFGYGMSDFPLVKNKAYKPTIERMDNLKLRIMELLWNEGCQKIYTSAKLDGILGKSAYCNNSKLTYSPWSLVTKEKQNMVLTEKGISFIKNEIPVSSSIIKDATTNRKYIVNPSSDEKYYSEFRESIPSQEKGK